MDRFRVKALCRCLDNENLTSEQRRATLAMLELKLDILIQGARKRGNDDAVQSYRQLKDRYLAPGYT
jgi:hypothetical protein